MLWLALGAGLLAFFVWLGRTSSKGNTDGGWRVATGVVALAGLIAAAVFAVRGAWSPALVLALGSVTAALLSRRIARPKPPAIEMSEEQARALLGVSADADDEAIQNAYVHLMRRVHPDTGGATGLAAQLNAARDRLMKQRR